MQSGRHQRGLTSVAISSDGKLVASGSVDGTMRIWDRVGDEAVTPWFRLRELRNIMFSPDGRALLATTTADRAGTWQVGGEPGSIEDLASLSSFMAQARVDPSGRLRRLTFEEVTALLELLERQFPTMFSASALFAK